jgi:site-specific recombinase XerD
MTVTDYDAPGARILVAGKYARERWVFLTTRAARALDTWLAVRYRHAANHTHIFCNLPSGVPLADRVLRYIVAYRGAQAYGPYFRLHPHMLRHSMATHLTDAGIDMPDLARLLGHASLDSTLVYQHVAPNRLAAIHATYSEGDPSCTT